MKNITVTVDDETYRRARIAAAIRETSVSRLVKDFLSGLSSDAISEFERKKAHEAEVRERVRNFSVSENISREDLHQRKKQ